MPPNESAVPQAFPLTIVTLGIYYVDGNLACSLKNGTSEDVEISEGSHTVQVKVWGLIQCFKGTVGEGTDNWFLSFMDGTFIGKFVLRESKPFYGKFL